MKLFTAFTILSTLLSNYVLAVVTMNIVRGPQLISQSSKRHLYSRALVTSTLTNNATRGSYYVQVSVGTPAQTLNLYLDTGSSDVWILDSNADLCTTPALQQEDEDSCGTTYTPSESSTYKLVDANGFNITYEDDTGAAGDYIQDTFSIGGVTITALEMGLAHNTSIGDGLMGIGYDSNEASDSQASANGSFVYPSVIDTMVSQKLITRKAYSLYLNDAQASTGSIIFGGMDTDKFYGDLLEMPIVPATLANGTSIYTDSVVVLTSFGITGLQEGPSTTLTAANYEEPVVLDSGTTFTYLPTRLTLSIYTALNAAYDSASGLAFVDCSIASSSPNLTFDFGFGTDNKTLQIHIPSSELIYSLEDLNISSSDTQDSSFSSNCGFGILPNDNTGESVLGDSFLRSAYVIYDLQNNQIAIAQTNFNSSTSNIIEFEADSTSIPEVSGVASSLSVTATAATALPGVGGLTTTSGSAVTTVTATVRITKEPSAVATVFSTGSASAAAKSSAMSSLPRLDVKGLLLMGISSCLVAIGGSWFTLI